MKPLKLFVIVVLAAAVTGCFENRRNTDQLCKDNPKLRCERMNQNDGQCKLPRTKLIWHRYDSFRNPSDVMLIKEYALTAEYKKCIELASDSDYRSSRFARKRFNALVNAGEDLETLVEEIESPHPLMLYISCGVRPATKVHVELLQLKENLLRDSRNAVRPCDFLYQSRPRENRQTAQ